jgi:tetratricopeptide (TPR) repeat protein
MLDWRLSRSGEARELDAEFAAAYADLGTAYDAKGELDIGLINFNRAIELEPEFAPAYYGRAFSYYHKGDLNKAVSDFEKVVQIGTNPKQVEDARQMLRAIGK